MWKVHIWECMPYAMYKIRVNFRDEYKRKLMRLLPENRAEVIRQLNNTRYAKTIKVRARQSRWFNWFRYNDLSIPLWIGMGLSEMAGVSLEEMEQNITFYKKSVTPERLAITNPILPIEFNPELVSLASHFCFDGSLPADGKGAFYSQKNGQQIINFMKKVRNCFGFVPINVNYDRKGIANIRLPRVVGDVCKHVCGFEHYGTFYTSIPETLFKLPREYKIAILSSAIVDEGGVTTEYIQISMKNEKLVKNVRRLCEDLGYNTSETKERRDKKGVFYFYIKSIEKVYKDIEEIKRKYETISLTFKEDSLQSIMGQKSFSRGESNAMCARVRLGQIVDLLGKPKTARQLSRELRIPPRTVRRHLTRLCEEGSVTRKKISTSYVYFLSNCGANCSKAV